MKNLIFFILILCPALASEKIYHIPIKGTIDLGLPAYVSRGLDKAKENDAVAVIFDIDTFGGRVDAATQIKDAILSSDLLTIAFINEELSRQEH